MINISIKKNNKQYQEFIFKGHALYDDYGKDIVCAGVSSVLITTVNAIIRYDEKAITKLNETDTSNRLPNVNADSLNKPDTTSKYIGAPISFLAVALISPCSSIIVAPKASKPFIC